MANRQVGSVSIRVRPDADGFRRDAQRQIRQQGPIEAEGTVDFDNRQMDDERRAAERRLKRRPITIDGEVDLDIETTLRGLERSMRDMEDMAQSARDTNSELDRLGEQMTRMQRSMNAMELGVSEDDFNRLRDRIGEMEAQLSLSTESAEETLERFKQAADHSSVTIDLEADADVSSAVAARAAMGAAVPDLKVNVGLNAASVATTILGVQALGRHAGTIEMPIALRGLARAEASLLRLSRDRVIRMRTTVLGRGWETVRGGLRSLAGLGDMDEMIRSFEAMTQQLDVYGTKIATIGTVIGSAVNVGVHALGGLMVTLGDVTKSFGLLAAAPTALLAAFAGMQVHSAIWGGFGDALDGYAGALEALPPNAQRAVKAIEALSEQVNDSVQDGFWSTMSEEITRFADTVAPVLERGMHRTAQVYADGLTGMLDLAQRWAESGQLGAAFTNINRMFEGVADGAVEAFDAFMTVGMRASRLFPRLGHSMAQAMSGLNQWTQWASETGRIDRWIMQGVESVRQLAQAGSALGGIFGALTQTFRRAGIGGLPEMVRGLQAARDLMQSPEFQFRASNIFEGMAIGARETWAGVKDLGRAFYDAHQWARELSIVIGQVSREGLERIAQIIDNPIFQRGSVDLFEGVRDSLITLAPAAEYLGNILGELGTLSGSIIREMAPGINTLLGMFSDLATQLGPSFAQAVDPLTDFIDNLGHTMRWNVNNLIIPAVGGLLDAFNSLPAGVQRFVALAAVASRWLPAFGQSIRSAGQSWQQAAQQFRNPIGPRLENGAFSTVGRQVRNLTTDLTQLRRSISTIGRTSLTGAAWFGGGAALMAPFTNQFADARRQVQGEMRVMRAAVASGAGAMNNILRTTVSSGFAAVGAAARGAGRLIGGMFSLLGGVPGIALLGVITAIGTIRRSAAEAEQQVDSMFETLKSGGEADLRADLASEMADSLVDLQAAGIDTKKVLDAMMDSENAKDFAADFENAGKAVMNMRAGATQGEWNNVNIERAREFLQGFGVDIEEVSRKESQLFLDVGKSLSANADAIDQARARMAVYNATLEEGDSATARTGSEARDLANSMEEAGLSFYTAEGAALRFGQAVATLGDAGQSADARISAMSLAMQMMSEDYSNSADIVVESWDRTQQAMRTAEEMVESNGKVIGNATDGIATDYESMSERQVLAIQGAQELHESALGRAVQAYDEAITAGETHADAVELAGKAYGTVEAEIDKFIETSKMSKDEAEAFRATMQNLGDVSNIEATLQLTNLSEREVQMAYDGLIKIREAGIDIDESEWMAFIAANPDQAFVAIANTETALLNFEASEYIADLSANEQKVLEAFTASEEIGALWESGDYAAVLSAITEMSDAENAIELMMSWKDSEGTAIFKSEDQATAFLETANGLAEDFEGTHTATFLEEGLGTLNESVEELNSTLQEIGREVYDLSFDSNVEEPRSEVRGLIDDLNLLTTDTHTMNVDADDQATPKFGPLEQKMNLFDQSNPRAQLDADDNASGTIQSPLTNLGFFNSAWAADLFANDGATPTINSPMGLVQKLATSWTAGLFADDNASGPAGTAKGNIESIPGTRNSNLTANGNVISFAGQAISTIAGVNPKTVNLGAVGNVISFAATAISTIAGVNPKNVALTATGNAITFASTAISTIGRIVGKTVTVSVVGNAISNLGRIVGLLGSVVSKTISVTARKIGSFFDSADGNLVNSVGAMGVRGMQKFANGGIAENHVAQIARPSSTFRVWAEPETGGEAYIPLASSKRARSTKIWEETGRRLGVYANGGVVGGQSEAQAPQRTVQIVNHYPRAEATSDTLRRGLDYASMWDSQTSVSH